MAVTFRGSVQTYLQFGNLNVDQNLFVIENGNESRVNLNIRRLSLQNDYVAANAAVMPIAKTSRASGTPAGGVILDKNNAFYTTQTSDPAIKFRAGFMEGAPITGVVAGDIVWEQFIGRSHTAVGQIIGDDRNMLPMLVSMTGKEFKIRPGEMLLIKIIAPTAATNSYLINNYFVECVWEEDAIATFSIGGTVTLNSVPVEGAKVIVVEANDTSLTNAVLREVITTPAGGTWSSTIRTGRVGGAFVQYVSGGTKYTAPGSPFLENV